MNSLSLDVDQLTDIPRALFDLAAIAKAKRNYVRLCEKTINENFEIFDWLERHSLKASFSFDTENVCICFTGDGPLLADFWRTLRQSGYNTASRPKRGDTRYYGWWEKEQCVTISLSFSSSVCRRVQTGTRTVTKEEPIFETVCGESLEIAEDSPPALGAGDKPPAITEDIPF